MGLERRVHGGDQVAQLIGETDEGAPAARWGKFAEMDGDNAPRALHHELHQKRAHASIAAVVRIGPEGNDRQREQRGDYDRLAAPDALGKAAEENPSEQRADVIDDGDIAYHFGQRTCAAPGGKSDRRPACRAT